MCVRILWMDTLRQPKRDTSLKDDADRQTLNQPSNATHCLMIPVYPTLLCAAWPASGDKKASAPFARCKQQAHHPWTITFSDPLQRNHCNTRTPAM